MDRKEVQARLCKLTYDVMVKVFGAQVPADCWCGKKDAEQATLESLGCSSFEFDKRVLEFIEQATRDRAATKHGVIL